MKFRQIKYLYDTESKLDVLHLFLAKEVIKTSNLQIAQPHYVDGDTVRGYFNSLQIPIDRLD